MVQGVNILILFSFLGGHLNLLRHLYAEGCALTAASISIAAAGGGHLETLHFLRVSGCEGGGSAACMAAAQGGHMHVLKYLQASGIPLRGM